MENNKPIFLNNNRGNVVLVPGAVYQVNWPAQGRWPELNTILRFDLHTSWDGGYVFTVLDKKHQDMLVEAHGFPRGDSITYGRDQLRSAKFKRSNALDVLYGKKN